MELQIASSNVAEAFSVGVMIVNMGLSGIIRNEVNPQWFIK
jgi:hypothetical protein